MSLADRMGHGAREVRGRVKRTTGRVFGDPAMEAEGAVQQTVGRLGRADERIKDMFRRRRRRL